MTIVAGALENAGAQTHMSAACPDDDSLIGREFDALEAAGGADILLHSGVAGSAAPSHSIDLEAWRLHVSADIDLRFMQSAEFARRCIAAGRAGAILFLMPSPAPRAGRVGDATIIGAMDNLVKSLSVEWARDGIRVNAIASFACEDGARRTPEIGESLGNLAAYLLSDYGAYISGMVMGVDETEAQN